MKTKPTKSDRKYDIVVGIDSGQKSGVAIIVGGKPMAFYLCCNGVERHNAVLHPLVIYHGTSVLFVFEDWPAPFLPTGKRMGHKQILAMGENRGKWLGLIEDLQTTGNDCETALVATRTWRAGYGLNKYHKKEAKEQAVKIANALFPGHDIIDDNVAEACLIAKWGWENYGKKV